MRLLTKIIFVFFATSHCVVVYANSEDQQAVALAKKSACLGCHATNKKIVGPSFQSVAQKYKNDAGAQMFLKNKITKGGAGSWGVVPMPANPGLSDAQLTLLTGWILRGAPAEN
ncbi:c-type cytochrome [Polynucleobacter necessarius]|uniref:c-type cytochrome n=1 Tax=Polynucleobacter necessarius TaxID=576610 RepID=UPI000E08CEF6|nr:c-type cytochrome [Polynucleobacter necessarius]